MPLGILLAAAWSTVISPPEIAAEIGKDLDFLQTDLQDIPTRQRTLRTVFLHTWHRLSAAERACFMRLSVFRGGATRAAVQSVTGATLGVLAALNDKALLWRLPNGRYEIHELLRQFAAEQLAADRTGQVGGQEQAKWQHCCYYLTLLGEQEQPLQGPHQRAALDAIRADFENISAAWFWALQQHEFSRLPEAMRTLYLFCEIRGNFREGVSLFSAAVAELTATLASGTADPSILYPLVGQALVRLGACEVMVSNYDRGVQSLQQGLQHSVLDRDRAFALLYLSVADSERGELALAHAKLHESLAICQQCDDLAGMAYALNFLHAGASDYAEERRLCTESLALWRKVGRPDRVASLLNDLAWNISCLGDYAKAHIYWRESIELCDQLELRHDKAWALECMGFVAWCQGELASAEQSIQEALAIYTALGRQLARSMCLAELALVLSSTGDLERAIRVARQAVAITRAIDGQMMLTMSLNYLGVALLAAGDFAEARATLLEAVWRAWAYKYFYNLMIAFYYFAELLVLEGCADNVHPLVERRELTVTLLSCVRTQTATWQIFKDKAAQLQAQIEGMLPTAMYVTAIERGQSCILEELVNALLGAVEAG